MQLELTTPLYSLGEKLFVFVCRSTSSAVTPSCISWSPTGSILNLSIFAKGNLLLRYITPFTWGNQREVRELSSSPYQGPHAITELLHLLGLWFAYYCDKMIGHASDMGSTKR